MEALLTTCLSKICEEISRESDLNKKMKLVDDVTEFLLVTPDVFSSSDMTWRQFLYSSIRHLLSSKLPAKDRKKLFKLISSLVLGFGRTNWFMAEDGEWSDADVTYFHLLSRYTCIEIAMLLDDRQPGNIDSDFLGCILIILEHCLICLVECDAVTSHLTPDQICALIVSIRSVSLTMMEFADLHKDDDEYTLIIRSMIRLISLWVREDNEGVSVDAGNTFAAVVVAVLMKCQDDTMTVSADSHDLLHAAICSISALPPDCLPAVDELRTQIIRLLSICQHEPDPDSSCASVRESFRCYVDGSAAVSS